MNLHYDDRAESLNVKFLLRVGVKPLPAGKRAEGFAMLAQWPEHLIGFCLALIGAVASFVFFVALVPLAQLALMPLGYTLAYKEPDLDEVMEAEADKEFLACVVRAFLAILPVFMPSFEDLKDAEKNEVASAWAECLIEAMGQEEA